METFIASRLTNGNRFFRSKITIDEYGVTLHDPGLYSRVEKTIPYEKIFAVNIDCPFMGFSAINIETTGRGKISSKGFTSYKVKRMKNLILNKI